MTLRSVYTEAISLPVKLVLITIACAIFVIGIYVAMHVVTTGRLKCPHCGKKGWCKKVLTKE